MLRLHIKKQATPEDSLLEPLLFFDDLPDQCYCAIFLDIVAVVAFTFDSK